MPDFLHMDRRELMTRALFLVGASAAVSITPYAFAQALEETPRALDSTSFALLTAIADTIVPRTDTKGAIDADIPAKVDALLTSWATEERREAIIAAMATIDKRASDELGKGFAELSPDERYTLLAAHDAEALKPVPRTDGLTGMAAMMAGPAFADPGYGKLKELVVVLYYSSEIGLTEELTYEHTPGDWTPSIPVTPETRVAAGGTF